MSLPSSSKLSLAPALAALSVLSLSAEDILHVNYDDFPAAGAYSFAYAGYGEDGTNNNIDVGSSIVQSSGIELGTGIDGSSGLLFTADTTATEAALVTPNRYTYMGFGIGTSATPLTPLTTGDLAFYTLNLSVSASGLTAGTTTATGLVDVRFLAPDGTLQPDDADTDADVILSARYTNAVEAEAAFKENQFRLNTPYEVRDGSLANFETHFASVDFMQVVVEMNGATNQFGFDADNTVVVDNILLTDTPPPAPPAENPVVILDFDNTSRLFGGSYYAFAGPEANNVGDLVRTDDIAVDSEAGPSLAQITCLDTSPWDGADPLNGGGWLGFAGTSAIEVLPSVLPSPSLEDYKLSFKTRSSGFLATPSGKMIVALSAPDGTVSPADNDGERDLILRLRVANDRGFSNEFSILETYSTYSFNFADLEVEAGGGSLELFEDHYQQISLISFALEGITSAANTGFDADNCIYMDDIQILHLTPPAPEVGTPEIFEISAVSPNQFSLSFQSTPGNSYAIQSSPDLATDFTNIQIVVATGSTTTYSSTQALVNHEFFRVEDLGIPVD